MLVEIFENAWEDKKSKCQNRNKWGPKICKMMSWFKILPQNSNRITFDLFFGHKTRKLVKHPISQIFDIFFCQKRIKSYLIWFLRLDLESSHHFTYFTYCRTSFVMIWTFWFFGLPCICKIFKEHAGPLNIFFIFLKFYIWGFLIKPHKIRSNPIKISNMRFLKHPTVDCLSNTSSLVHVSKNATA